MSTTDKLVALDPFDGSPDSTGASSEHVKGVVTKERINDVATVLESRSKGVIFHTGPSSSGASPSSNTLRPQHKQRRNYPRTEDHLTGDNDSQILYPAPINKPITDVNEVVNPPASSPPQAENNLGIDEGLVQLSELPPRAAGYVSGIQELNRKVAMLQCEIGELRRLGEDVPPAYPGSWYGKTLADISNSLALSIPYLEEEELEPENQTDPDMDALPIPIPVPRSQMP
ncbi:hypothetical protein DXG01_003967 [Tephrocybe rancida]|nr:hypothetical protein DXG01_003967 [Tephrocybe rancida]